MIQQRPGDVLEIEFEGGYYYLVVITKIIEFGGNIVYAFHGDGSKKDNFNASLDSPGFNICTDLLMPKTQGQVRRISKVINVQDYLVSKMRRSTHPLKVGEKAKEWWLRPIDGSKSSVKRVKKLTKEQEMAMDGGTYSFDLVVEKI
ncbi:hypothetical protein [Teredinibacter sp. KSP-S5-2]|uniref:hypothetical protein n=1 Tax=Teredinibacter sp. KSP-S5-2 TaxID=3034506 RepID=UPI002934A23F|nr:hypothetical protein [Teredinibacter sp. KSP-S5-2]WNO10602.1 hypothetical protein P5V12_05385 [Teredinibacter sp. KSP-S5-2]